MENKMPIEVVFSFDVTGSMRPAIANVRQNLENILTPLFKEIPNLKIGLVAHGDYQDLRYSDGYLTKWQPLTNDIYTLTQFVRNVSNAYGGGDGGECYELVLNEAKSLNWSLNSKKLLVMIGDDIPHVPGFRGSPKVLNWKTEANDLINLGINIHTIRCLGQYYPTQPFYDQLAQIGNGHALRLDQFLELKDLIMAIVYNQYSPASFKNWEDQVVTNKRMTRSLDNNFGVLSGRKTPSERYKNYNTGLVPVEAGRFQILNVDADTDIKGFVQTNYLPFKIGRGFYQFTKTEDIQEKKEVVLRDKFSGNMFTGPEARNMIGVPYGTRGHLRPADLGKYDIFVQSTSVNRKLKRNTQFLYEVDQAA